MAEEDSVAAGTRGLVRGAVVVGCILILRTPAKLTAPISG